MSGYNTLDTRAFIAFLSDKDTLISEYERINKAYDTIVSDLTEVWKGHGADAFGDDARNVKTNLVGIKDVLTTICDTLADCLEIFEECDHSLGESNKNALSE